MSQLVNQKKSMVIAISMIAQKLSRSKDYNVRKNLSVFFSHFLDLSTFSRECFDLMDDRFFLFLLVCFPFQTKQGDDLRIFYEYVMYYALAVFRS